MLLVMKSCFILERKIGFIVMLISKLEVILRQPSEQARLKASESSNQLANGIYPRVKKQDTRIISLADLNCRVND